MKVKHSASQSFKALIATTILIVVILNATLLVPVSPVFAESEPEEQTCEICRSATEVSVSTELLWYYSKVDDDGVNRTIAFVHLTYFTETSVQPVYVLSYVSQHNNYRVSVISSLGPNNSTVYGLALTHFDYMPLNEEKMVTFSNTIKLDFTLTLSDHYRVLAKSMKQLAADYANSDNETLKEIGKVYSSIAPEAIILANLVRENLEEYDKSILLTLAFITDLAPGTFDFWLCTLIVSWICTYFAGMACDYVAGIVAAWACAIVCGGPWNWICWAICMAGMWNFVYIICREVAKLGCGLGSNYICQQI